MKKAILALAATSLVFGATAASAQPYRDRDRDGIPNARELLAPKGGTLKEQAQERAMEGL